MTEHELPAPRVSSEDSLPLILPEWSAPRHIKAFTTTRRGGISEGPYQTMNLGLHVGDEHAAVLENRRRLLQVMSMPCEPLWLNQTHSAKVIDADVQGVCAADGAYTDHSGVVLAVLTADCLPIVIVDRDGIELAVVHAGWRGLAGGIVENAVGRFRSVCGLQAWLGPAIGSRAFEVGDDVKTAFVTKVGSHEQFFKPGISAGKYWCDLYALARAELVAAGCDQVFGGQYCTYSQSEYFHSHRRDGTPSGRMATVAWIVDSK
jgi:YfiH family protein